MDEGDVEGIVRINEFVIGTNKNGIIVEVFGLYPLVFL
jgi:hypothetical protein